MSSGAAATRIRSNGPCPAQAAAPSPAFTSTLSQPCSESRRFALRRELLDDLDAIDPGRKAGEHRGLVAEAGADVEDAVARPDIEQIRHQGDDVGLRDRLAESYRQGRVEVGEGAHFGRDELVARHLCHRVEHRAREIRTAGIANPPSARAITMALTIMRRNASKSRGLAHHSSDTRAQDTARGYHREFDRCRQSVARHPCPRPERLHSVLGPRIPERSGAVNFVPAAVPASLAPRVPMHYHSRDARRFH